MRNWVIDLMRHSAPEASHSDPYVVSLGFTKDVPLGSRGRPKTGFRVALERELTDWTEVESLRGNSTQNFSERCLDGRTVWKWLAQVVDTLRHLSHQS